MILETEWKGFPSGTKAAAAGGVTTLVDMPLNNFPSTVPRETLELKLKAVESRIYVDVSMLLKPYVGLHWSSVLKTTGFHLQFEHVSREDLFLKIHLTNLLVRISYRPAFLV
ncbi:hypothetical protein M0R45_004829 [Rubus argutus]|uniref:Uncharacterized protein n=1 Tax=Rubus argutus TaxID=59490 RepID=A0AAW1YLA0_RUBAR